MTDDTALLPLKAWETFYFFVGTSAAALIGLQFVVVAFVGESGAATGEETLAAFGTPTVMHLCAVVLISATLVAPWASLPTAGLLVALAGLAGLAYAALVVRRARRQRNYQPVFEDWLFHAALPLVAYAGVTTAGAFVVRRHPLGGLVLLAASTLLLLFIAIHNAWDTATYVAVQRAGWRQRRASDGADAPDAATALDTPNVPNVPNVPNDLTQNNELEQEL